MICWKYMLDELLVAVILLCSAPCCLCQDEDVSNKWAVIYGEYPFLVLVEIKSSSGGSAEYVNGVLTSLSCVLTLANTLAQLPAGRPSPSLHLRVYAGLTDLRQLVSSPQRDVHYINNELQEKENTYFPNLVILQLNTPFQESNGIRPVVFNVGMLSPRSKVVGWAHLAGSNITLVHAVVLDVIPWPNTRCNDWRLAEFLEQMCCYELETHPLQLSEGALLVDQNYLTAIKQFDTYLQSHLSTSIALFVRISYFINWIQKVVLDPVPSKVFLKTKFDNDDIKPEPEDDKRVMVSDSKINHRSFWNYLLLATVAVLQYI